ncbi:MAG: site-specific integrase [Lachnospiraceae bacterium]|nr:site-specific integrase [Lachnospiraceae bacterium]
MADAKKVEWIKLESGIRARKHPTRKHGVKADLYFVLRFTVDGKPVQEALGWASEGMTLEKARIELAKLKEAKRTGDGARSLRERRQENENKRLAEEKAAEEAKRSQVSVAEFWAGTYWPSQSHKAKGSLVAENALWKKWIEPVIGENAIAKISVAELEKIKVNMTSENLAPASIKYAFAVVSQIWSAAVKYGLVTGVCPTKHVAIPKKDNKRQRYLTKEESQKLLSALATRSKISYDMAILGLDCGLRFGEIASLCWEDCDFEGGRMLIRDPKARANRFAFMTSRVRKMFEDRGIRSQGLIFTDAKGNKIDRVSKTFRRVADELFNQKVEDARLKVCFHTLRHTFASWLVEGCVSLYEVKELMGHADFSTTQRYSHLSPDGLKSSVRILEDK